MTYVRYATRARKHVVKLDDAKDRDLIDADLVAVTVLDKGTGTWTLIFVFPDGTQLELADTEVAAKDVFEWDISELRLTNTAQAGVTLKLVCDQQIGVKAGAP